MVDRFQIEVKKAIHRIYKQVGVFEVGEQKKVHHHTHNDPELLPSLFLTVVDQVSQVEIRYGGEDQNHEKEPGGLPVKKETGRKQKGVPGSTLLVKSRVNQKHHEIKAPEKEPGEDQRLLRIEKKYVPRQPTH